MLEYNKKMVFSFKDPITRLFLIRHAQTVNNAKGIISADATVPLNPHGRSQGRALAKRMRKDFVLDHIYSSPMQRAYETAQFIAQAFNLEIEKDDDLIEFNYGIFEGRDLPWIKENIPDEYENFFAWLNADSSSGMKRPDITGMEPLTDLRARIQKFIEKILDRHEGENIALVSHGGFVKYCLTYFMDGDFNKKAKFVINNASLSIVDFYKGRPTIILMNDYRHTKDQVMTGFPKPP